jgi:hypothetical protein
MNDRLNHLVEQLAAAPTDRSLDDLDARIARSIAERRAEARVAWALTPVRVAAVGVALVMGVAAGGVTAASSVAPHPAGAVFAASDLAPSSLLEGRQ